MALKVCKRASQDPNSFPPHVMEFFRIAKTGIEPVFDYHAKPIEKGSIEIANEHLNKIKSITRMYGKNLSIEKRSILS
jgi:hypothetical protein